jgi:hypothetical protein
MISTSLFFLPGMLQLKNTYEHKLHGIFLEFDTSHPELNWVMAFEQCSFSAAYFGSLGIVSHSVVFQHYILRLPAETTELRERSMSWVKEGQI